MNLQQLMDYCRLKARDKDASLRTDAELIEDINEAIDEAALRTDTLYETAADVLTPAIVEADRLTYDLDADTLQNYSVRMVDPADSDRNKVLIPSTLEEIYQLSDRWEDKREFPTHFLTNFAPRTVRLYPVPSTTEHGVGMTLEVWRSFKGAALVNPSDEIPLPWHTHRNLHHWVLYRIFSDHDLDTYDEARGERHHAEFDRLFGERPSAKSLSLRERTKGTIKPRFTVDGSDYGRNYYWWQK